MSIVDQGLALRVPRARAGDRDRDGEVLDGVTEFLNNPMTEFLMWAGLVVAILLAIGWFLSYTAVRLDRLHQRLKATSAALDAQLVRRAELARHIALTGGLDPASATLLAATATHAMETPAGPWTAERAAAEEELTEVLRLTGDFLDHEGAQDPDDDLSLLRGAGTRVQLARRFHNEAVRDVIKLRQRPHSRWFRLAGHAPMPEPVTIDDHWPDLGLGPGKNDEADADDGDSAPTSDPDASR